MKTLMSGILSLTLLVAGATAFAGSSCCGSWCDKKVDTKSVDTEKCCDKKKCDKKKCDKSCGTKCSESTECCSK